MVRALLHGTLLPIVRRYLLYHFGREIQKAVWSFISSDSRNRLCP